MTQKSVVKYYREGGFKYKVQYKAGSSRSEKRECTIHVNYEWRHFVGWIRRILKSRKYNLIHVYINHSETGVEAFAEKLLENIFYYKKAGEGERGVAFELEKVELIM